MREIAPHFSIISELEIAPEPLFELDSRRVPSFLSFFLFIGELGPLRLIFIPVKLVLAAFYVPLLARGFIFTNELLLAGELL